MTTVGVRELRQNASRVLDQVKRGEVVGVTERGVLVAHISPAATSAWQSLIDTGIVVPAPDGTAQRLKETRPIATAEGVPGASDVLKALRGLDS